MVESVCIPVYTVTMNIYSQGNLQSFRNKDQLWTMVQVVLHFIHILKHVCFCTLRFYIHYIQSIFTTDFSALKFMTWPLSI